MQVTKDPMGSKGARLTTELSIAGRYLVYVPEGTLCGVSRRLPDEERQRLRKLCREIKPDHAGVIIRTAAEGISEKAITAGRAFSGEGLADRGEAAGDAGGTLGGVLGGRARHEDRARPAQRGVHPGAHRRRCPAQAGAGFSAGHHARAGRPGGALPGQQTVVRDLRHRRGDPQGAGAARGPAVRRLPGHRPHRGHDRGRRQHRSVRGQEASGGHHPQHQPRGLPGGGPPTAHPRHRRHRGHRLHRHVPPGEPGAGAGTAERRAGQGPHQDLRGGALAARPGGDDPAERHRRHPGHHDRHLSHLSGPGVSSSPTRRWPSRPNAGCGASPSRVAPRRSSWRSAPKWGAP